MFTRTETEKRQHFLPTSHRRWITFSVITIILLLLCLWFFVLPKRPFAFLENEDVAKVEYLASQYPINDSTPVYISYSPEHQEEFVEALQNLTLTHWLSMKRRSDWGGMAVPTMVTLKNGFTFSVDSGGDPFYICLVRPEMMWAKDTIVFLTSKSKETREARSVFHDLRVYYQENFKIME